MIYVCAFIAWCLLSVPIGMLLGQMISDRTSRDPAPDFISKKQSKARSVGKLGRAALSIVQSPSSGGR